MVLGKAKSLQVGQISQWGDINYLVRGKAKTLQVDHVGQSRDISYLVIVKV